MNLHMMMYLERCLERTNTWVIPWATAATKWTLPFTRWHSQSGRLLYDSDRHGSNHTLMRSRKVPWPSKNGMTSFCHPKSSTPQMKSKETQWHAKRSNPRVLLINAKIPASIAPASKRYYQNAPPTTKISAAIPNLLDPYLSPETKLFKNKNLKAETKVISSPKLLAVLCSFQKCHKFFPVKTVAYHRLVP